MTKRHLSKLLAMLTTIAITASLFAGCGGKKDPASPSADKPKEEQSLVYNLGQEPDTIDPGLSTTITAATVANQNFEGLMKFNAENKLECAVAEKVDFDQANPTKYVFHLRKDAKWSDGKAVTAKDFEYSWKRVLNPATASDYANQLYYLKNGAKYNSKEAKAEDVGVKATDDYTLQVELENPTPYFLQLCGLPTLMPVRQDIVEKDPDKWTLNPQTYLGNGPFKMTVWEHDSKMEFVKNDNYWNKANVKIEKMKFTMIAINSSALSAFETGEADYIDIVPNNEIPKLVQDKKMVTTPNIGTYYICANDMKAPLDNPKVRKALALAIDRSALIEAVWKDGRKAATGWVPYGINDAKEGKAFREVGGDFYTDKADVEQAKKLLAEAGYPDGKGFPVFEYAYNKSETHAKIAQAVQDMWKKNLNINIKLNEVDWKVFVPQRKEGNFELSRNGWVGDYFDPMTFMDILVTKDGNNDAHYSNPKYDELVLNAKKEKDPEKRMQMIHDAEKILMDDMAIIPLAFYVDDVCIKPYLKGTVRVSNGMIYFDKAYIEGKTAAK
ncbi:peptide ABC transporter substrate-binding protein [Clostridium omnivorum]|uniref:Peptide ABC transporter substrate-binding protein n=1 Tax=Clostridium omnivorum TaxID=1604902 RepID=A0ABQ5N0J0_9CLOT|nr:peptide ABC transporter substrate-binding protein [Clostridium sp. E14]GLC28721.1 peptide ABC transporter substrate-binding protein [Clostridium sp. E14]